MPQLTGNEVLRAARDFAERGIEPTQIPVRAHLGHRGSYTTISRGLRTWRAAQCGREALPILDEVERLALELGARVWRRASEMVESGKAALRRDLSLLRAELEAEIHAQDQIVQDLEAQVKEARVHSEMLEHNFDRYDAKSKKAVAGLQKELAHERDTVRLLRQRADQDAAAMAELREKLVQVEARSTTLTQTALAQPVAALPTSADPTAGALRVD